MNWLDIVLGVIVLWSVAASIRRGFTREVIGLVSTVLALVLGIWFYGSAGAFVLPYVSTKAVANFLGFLAVFFGILLLGWLVSWLVGKILKATGLSWFDRLLGAVFGLVRGLLIAVAIVTAIVAFAPGVQANEPPASVAESRLAPYVIDAGHILTAVAPRELKDAFAQRYDLVKKIWRDAEHESAGKTERPRE